MIVLKILLTAIKILGIILLVLLGLILLISLIPVGVTAEYSSDGPKVTARAGPVKIPLFPRPKKPADASGGDNNKKKKKKGKKGKQDQQAQKPDESEEQQKKPKKKKGGLIQLFRELLGIVLGFLGEFRHKLRIRELVLLLSVGGFGSDPSKAAQTYGKAWAAIGGLMPLLMQTFRIDKQDVGAEIDFTESENRIYALATLRIFIGQVLLMGIHYGFRALWAYLKFRRRNREENPHKHKKGGNAHGTSSE